MTTADLPTALQRLVEELQARGFSTTGEQYDEAAFGNRLLELANPERETASHVRLVKDRGLWSVEIDVAGKWRGPYRLLLALNGSRYSRRALSHEEMLRYTLEVLDRLPPAESIQPLTQRLDELDREYSSSSAAQ